MAESIDHTHAVAIVVVREREALIWHGLPPRTERVIPQRIIAPDAHRDHRHVRTGQAHHLHHVDADDPKYFDAIASSLGDAERILLVGHGHGRSNLSHGFAKHVERHHRGVSERVIGEMNANLPALQDHEILDLARHWYAGYVKTT
jgi:hypothetical protein